MADRTINQGDATATERDKSMNATPKPISRATLLMLAATVVFIIIASILFAGFFNSPAGTNNTNPSQADSSPSGTDSRAKP
jgi:hypothetical protein